MVQKAYTRTVRLCYRIICPSSTFEEEEEEEEE